MKAIQIDRERFLVSQAMTKNIVTIEEENNLHDVITSFKKKGVSHLLVVEQGNLVGILSRTDLANKLLDLALHTSGYTFSEMTLKNTQVEDVMTRDVLTLDENESIEVAIEILKKGLFHAIPITNKKGLIGIITAMDIMEFYQKVMNY